VTTKSLNTNPLSAVMFSVTENNTK